MLLAKMFLSRLVGSGLFMVLLWGALGLGGVYAQIVPPTPSEEQESSNSFDFQNRVVDADNAVSLARSSLQRRDYRQASRLITEAIKIYSRHNQKASVGKAFTMLGFINREIGNDRAADIYFRNALVSYRDAEDFLSSGKVAGMLGNIYLRQGSVPKACRSWDIAYEFFRQVGEEFYAEKSFDLIREHDCPDVIRYLSPQEAFPDPVASLGADARRIDILLGRELPEVENLEREDAVASVVGQDFAGISREGRGVLDALRVDALTKSAEELIAQSRKDATSPQKRISLLSDATDIFARLENFERVGELQLELARVARGGDRIEEMQSYYDAAINTARQQDDFDTVVSLSLELADGLKNAERFTDAQTVALRAERVASRIESSLYLAALEERASIYMLDKKTDEGCRVFTRLVQEGDKQEETLLVNRKILLMARSNCPSPGGEVGTASKLSKEDITAFSAAVRQEGSNILEEGSTDAATQFYLQLASYQIDRQDYVLAETSYLAAADLQSEQGNYDKVTSIMQSLVALSRLMQDEIKQQFYSLRVRTSRLDVIHRNKTPIELGNLGIDAAQEGDTDAACYFWARAGAGIDPAKDASITGVITSLSADYKCEERLQGLAEQ